MIDIKIFFRCIKNWMFCKKYPFWKLTDIWYDYNTSINDPRKGIKNFFIKYNFTWYDEIPVGWRKAFGKQLSKDIKRAGSSYLKNHRGKTWEDIISWSQIKEKWGELCLYASAIEELGNILERYEWLSIGYCIDCGKPARYRTRGWVEFYCKDCCLKDYHRWDKSITEQQDMEYLCECRLTKKDIPTLTKYEGNSKVNVDLSGEYGIDYIKLWGLDKEEKQ